MDLYDWLLFLHMLGAFAVVGGLTALWALVFGTRAASPLLDPGSAMTLGRIGGILVGAGMMVTLALGIWLAIDVEGYELWDGWILGAFALWAIGGWAGGQAGKAFTADPVAGRAAGIRFQAVNTVAVLVILALMIWKPGA